MIFSLTSNEVSTHVLPFACLDTLGGGALLALAHSRGVYPALARWQLTTLYALLGALTLALLSGRTAWLFHVFAEGVLAIVFADLIGRLAAPTAARGAWDRLLRLSWLQHLGKISYGIYVIHFFVPNQISRVMVWMSLPSSPKNLTVAALSVVVSVLLAELSWRYFEAPLIQLKRYFSYDGAPLTVSSAGAEKG